MTNPNYAGRHLIADLWGCQIDGNLGKLEGILCEGAASAGATVLSSRFHTFGEGHGFTGIIALAESHISIHTWPEKDYVALDIFMCGKCDPKVAFEYIKEQLNPTRVVLAVHKRGVVV